MNYAKSDLDLIKSKLDILTYLEERGISFRNSGASWVGLCPVHNERSPSFHVKPATNTFRCFGCGISGDIFSLVQEMDSLSFPGAVQALASEAGIELQIDEDPNYKRRQRLLQILRMTSEWYRHNYNQLPVEHPAKQNLAERNLLEYSYIDASIGFAPSGSLIGLLTQKNFSLQEIIDAGLATVAEEGRPSREKFRNRLVWTIYDVQGNPIAFSARKIYENDNGPKYMNSPQTELYNKSKALLGLSDAKKSIAQEQEVFVVEGQTDVMALKAAGKKNTVASCGTAFGTDHANMLFHLSNLGKESEKFRIVFCFDGDAAGTKAAKTVFEKNKNLHLNSYVVRLLNKDGSATDPCDFRKDNGDEALVDLVTSEPVSIVEFILLEELHNWDVTRPEGQSSFINKAREILSLISDPIQYSAYLRKVSFWAGVSFAELSNMTKPRTVQAPTEVRTQEALEGDPYENKILAAIIQYPEESFVCLSKYRLDSSFFNTRRDLALDLIDQVETNNLNFADPVISKLNHLDLMIQDTRQQFGIDLLFKNYLKHLHAIELAKVNARFAAESEGGSATAFFEILNEQKKLKEKYIY